MSDTKRILPWEFRDNAHNVAQAITKVELYWIHPKEGKFMACIDDEVLNSISTHDTLDAAMDACEADYIARCSEFLRVAGPGQVVVEIADAEALTEFFNDFCPPVWIDQACHRITDAIMEARDD